MRDLIKELEYYMAGELEIYVGLLQYAKSKKTALIKNDLDGIEMLVKLEDEAINRLHTASAQREDLFDRIAKEDGYEGKITYEYIIKNVPDEERRELDRLRGRYQEVVRELSALNELNQGLLQTQLQYTSFCMDMLMQAKPVGGTYGSTGQANAEYQQGRRLIDQEA